VAQWEAWWLSWEAWWLSGSAPDCIPAVPGSNPASPQPTADCRSPGGLPPGMAVGRGLTSVRGNRGQNCENGPLVRQKTHKEKRNAYRELSNLRMFTKVTSKGRLFTEFKMYLVNRTRWFRKLNIIGTNVLNM
jgi:hypothetical protein